MEEEKKITPEPIMNIMWGRWAFSVLYTSVELEIYTKVSQGINTIKKISKELNIKEEGIKRLLNACVALKLLNKNEEIYSNASESNQFLVKEKPSYYGDMIIMHGKRNSLEHLKDFILNESQNREVLKERMQDTEQAKIFTRAMHNNAVGPAMILSKKFDFSKHKRILDLGGGSGAYSITLTKEYPNLVAIVFDLENVCEVAKEYIEKTNSKDKVKTIVGDFFKDNFPKEIDIVLLSQILHSWSIEKNQELLKKAYNALPKDGIVIINDFLLNEDKTSPLYPTLFALNMFTRSKEGNAYTESEVKDMLKNAGFKHLETIHLTGPVSSIIARK